MDSYLRHLVALARSSRQQPFDRPLDPPPSPDSGVREPRPAPGGGRGTAAAVAEPPLARTVRAVTESGSRPRGGAESGSV